MSFKNAKVFATRADSNQYHSETGERGKPDFVMSSSSARLFSQCPSRWVDGYNPPDSDSKDWGNMIDTRHLTPDLWEKKYVLQPSTYEALDKKGNPTGEDKEWNNNATVCREWNARQEVKGLTPVKPKEVAEVNAAHARLMRDETIEAFRDASEFQFWIKGEWHDNNGIVIPVQALIDYVPRLDSEFAKCLGDLKSTRNAAPRPFARFAYGAGYHIQAGWNMDLYTAAVPDEDRNTFCLVLQENFRPYQTGKRMLSQAFVDIGRATYKGILARYCECIKTGNWPDYETQSKDAVQGWNLIEPEAWMALEAASQSAAVGETVPDPSWMTADPNDVPS